MPGNCRDRGTHHGARHDHGDVTRSLLVADCEPRPWAPNIIGHQKKQLRAVLEKVFPVVFDIFVLPDVEGSRGTIDYRQSYGMSDRSPGLGKSEDFVPQQRGIPRGEQLDLHSKNMISK